MKKMSVIWGWGILISFLGSLPPGIMNLAAIQIEEGRGVAAAMSYAWGSMLAEVFIVRIALSCMSWLTRSSKFFSVLEWMTALLLILFSAVCFVTANSMQKLPSVLPAFYHSSFVTGILLSAINPMHIPFWMGWSTVLINKGALLPRVQDYNWYCLGIAVGTLAGFLVFILLGGFLLNIFQANQLLINTGAGLLLIVIAFLHVKKIILVPAAVRHASIFRRSKS